MEVRKEGEIWAAANFLQHKTNNREESNIILHTECNKAKSTNTVVVINRWNSVSTYTLFKNTAVNYEVSLSIIDQITNQNQIITKMNTNSSVQ